MRTKTLLLTSVLGAASLATAVAQTVYSVNAVGYVNVPTIPAGKFAILANPLNQPTNSITAVLPDAPAGTKIFLWDTNASAFFPVVQKIGTSWLGTAKDRLLTPGQGFFIQAPPAADLNITFVGEVPQTVNSVNPSVSFPAGYSILASVIPQAGLLETDLKFPAASGDKAFLFSVATQTYPKTYQRLTTWLGGEPTVDVAQGFFYNAKTAGTWTRAFSVNQ